MSVECSVIQSEIESSIECPICMDNIDLNKNYVITDCGHKFHTNCLLTNISQNGFSCPYCRDIMLDSIKDIDDEDNIDEDNINEENYINQSPNIEEDDLIISKPPIEYIVQKLVSHNITMEKLVKVLLRDHDEYDNEDNEFELIDDEVWENLRIIITNYSEDLNNTST
jgi:L-lysine 2,3-aminomutase